MTSAPSLFRCSPGGSCSSQQCPRSQQVSVIPQALLSRAGGLSGMGPLLWRWLCLGGNPHSELGTERCDFLVVTESLGLLWPRSTLRYFKVENQSLCLLSGPKHPRILWLFCSLKDVVWSSSASCRFFSESSSLFLFLCGIGHL